ncbi:MAG: ABC-2 transporter permease [bacterium]|nr:ABC-2 transporter permease [bacterium]
MRELIARDLRMNVNLIIFFWILLGAALVYFATSFDEPLPLIVLIAGYASMIPHAIVARDDKFKTVPYLCSLPVTRRQIVRAKYVLSWGTSLISGLWFLLIIMPMLRQIEIGELLTFRNVLLIPTLITLFLSLTMPFLLRFGLIGFFVMIFGTMALGNITLLLTKYFGGKETLKRIFESMAGITSDLFLRFGYLLFTLVLAVILALCAWLSLRLAMAWFAGKEL